MLPPARTFDERKRDILDRLTHDVDAWVATASPDGAPYLMPLSFLWDGTGLLMSTRSSNPTLVNLRARALAHVSLGQTRDVVLITGEADLLESISDELADSFAIKAGFDPGRPKRRTPISASSRERFRPGVKSTRSPGGISCATVSGSLKPGPLG